MEPNMLQLIEAFPELLKVSYSLDGWSRLIDQGRMAVYSKPTSCGFNVYKYEIYLDKSAEALSSFLFTHRPQFTRIMMQDEHAQILTKAIAPWAIAYSVLTNSFTAFTQPREFDLFCVRLKIKQDTWANIAVSPDLPKMSPDAVKGRFMYLAEICEELDLHKSKLTIVFLVDPMGKVPPFLYKRVVQSRLKAMDDLMRYLTANVF